MIAKLIIEVIDTEKGNYDYGKEFNEEEYGNQLLTHVRRTGRDIDNMFYSGRINYNPYAKEVADYKDVDFLSNDSECEALFLDAQKKEVNEEYFLNHIKDGKMFITIVNINPNSLENDAESELKFWIDDSKKILNDNDLTDEVKLRNLPTRNLKLKINDDVYLLKNNKIIQDFSNEKYKFFFGIIVMKIEVL